MADRLTLQSNFCIKFVTGSRKVPVALRFAQTVNYQSQSFVVESEISNPFVIITNEIQWEGSSGSILKKRLFGSLGEVSWPAFVNGLQRHFIWLTRQDPTKPNRTLSEYDFNYLHNKFFSRQANVSLYDFEAFWNWFGKSMQVLRYGRHCNSLWQTGIIYGFMGREDVENAVRNCELGTFILRFSERHAGQFGICYIGSDMNGPLRVKHYLVQSTDTGIKKTLPDFLLECPQFMYILQLETLPDGTSQLRKVPKERALEPYVNRQFGQPPPKGYEPLGSQFQ